MIKKFKRSGAGYVMPALLVIAVVMMYPLVYTLIMGFFENTLFLETPAFCGISQFEKLFSDKVFIGSIKNTLVWTFGSVFFQFSLGFALALLLHQPFVKGKALIRILLMIPWVTPSIIGSAVWKWMYNADYGIINFLFCSLGLIEKNQTWLSNPNIAMWSVIAVNTWKMFPFILLMIEASLQGVSKDLKEAALIDGANIWNIFKNVTWPSIAATCYSTILLMIIWTLNAFTFIYAMTEGGPAHKTEVMAMYIYKKAFMNYDFGIASAASAVLFVLSMAVSLVYLYLTRDKEGN
ncbi:sugar ABC transporter permease [Clostridiaceae bacterium]|jgi:multiple sugar transport system permease protein|nr:sugar ABC transporter permease [Lachnospiraceae bacterium]NBH71748.1 sugar ABC transporter permease [Clostridiaceae bacterium]RKI17456.1 sugar ABC transporter permease [bacterium 1XD21-70]